MEGESLRGGRYVVTRVLGEGAQGETFEAVDKKEGRLVAVKRFDVRGAKAWKDVELAEREARVLASLSHPRLPAYIEHFEEGGRLFLVMEKIEGESLGALLREGKRLAPAEVVRLLGDASGALAYLHGQGVVHRDLKPGNVLRRPDGSFAFVDFGAVRDRFRADGGSTVVGTFGYMAPEQFQGRALPASDVYAIAATCLAMLTGTQPEALPHRGLGIDVAAALGPRVDPALSRALARMLEPDPERRAGAVEVPRLAGARDATGGRTSLPGDRRGDRRAWKEARRAARRARREGRRGGRRHGAPFAPWLLVLVALAIARVAVSLALFVVVPTVLTLLSLVFGPGLRRAARAVTRGGRRAYEALEEQARDFADDSEEAAGGDAVDDAARVRVEPERARVAPSRGAGERGEDDELDAEHDAEDDRARRRRG